VKHLRHGLRDLSTRRRGELFGKRAHDLLGVVQGEGCDRHVGDWRGVASQPLRVVVGAPLGLHVVGVEARELAARPVLRDVAERRPVRSSRRLCGFVAALPERLYDVRPAREERDVCGLHLRLAGARWRDRETGARAIDDHSKHPSAGREL
jgi:hypothetical protein